MVAAPLLTQLDAQVDALRDLARRIDRENGELSRKVSMLRSQVHDGGDVIRELTAERDELRDQVKRLEAMNDELRSVAYPTRKAVAR